MRRNIATFRMSAFTPVRLSDALCALNLPAGGRVNVRVTDQPQVGLHDAAVPGTARDSCGETPAAGR
ncbi:MAG: hypothetical protein PWQ29_564 [Verrucomicrobiota bacterium]|jgi:hypothetical protein|nr:hypothetical protein [Verrucomicrobiota bacterium]